MASCLFPDTTVLINFAAVGRLDLLRLYLGENGRTVEAVAREIGRSADFVTELQTVTIEDWFGEPISISAESDVRAVENMRRVVFGGRSEEPLRHLGESQTIHVIYTDSEYSDSVMITDDLSANSYAARKGLVVRHTVQILEILVANGEISAADAYKLCEDMQDRDRTLLSPPTSAKHFS